MQTAHLPNKGDMDLKRKSENRGFLNPVEAALMALQHTVVTCWGDGGVFRFIQQP